MPRVKKTSDSSVTPNSSRAKKTPTNQPDAHQEPFSVARVTEEQIRQRAYQLFLQRGAFWGNPDEDWFQAEAEMRGHAS